MPKGQSEAVNRSTDNTEKGQKDKQSSSKHYT